MKIEFKGMYATILPENEDESKLIMNFHKTGMVLTDCIHGNDKDGNNYCKFLVHDRVNYLPTVEEFNSDSLE